MTNRPLAKVLFARDGKRGKGKHKTFPPFPLPFSRLMQDDQGQKANYEQNLRNHRRE